MQVCSSSSLIELHMFGRGQGGLLEYQNALGGRYQDWAKATPLYQQWLNTILQSKCHIITTNRKKQGYNMITEGNKTKVEKAGLDDEIREGYEYEMTIALEIINDKHMARASKDRSQLFVDKPEFIISVDTGVAIKQWCNSGAEINPIDISERISDCKTIKELLELYQQFPQFKEALKPEFEKQKRTIMINQAVTTQLNNEKINENGTP